MTCCLSNTVNKRLRICEGCNRNLGGMCGGETIDARARSRQCPIGKFGGASLVPPQGVDQELQMRKCRTCGE